jgi:hypothetical protein
MVEVYSIPLDGIRVVPIQLLVLKLQIAQSVFGVLTLARPFPVRRQHP